MSGQLRFDVSGAVFHDRPDLHIAAAEGLGAEVQVVRRSVTYPEFGQRKRSSSSCFPDCLAPSIFDKKDLVTVSQFAHGLRLKVKRG